MTQKFNKVSQFKEQTRAAFKFSATEKVIPLFIVGGQSDTSLKDSDTTQHPNLSDYRRDSGACSIPDQTKGPPSEAWFNPQPASNKAQRRPTEYAECEAACSSDKKCTAFQHDPAKLR